jgi:DNA-binding transcriptional regulator YiaG
MKRRDVALDSRKLEEVLARAERCRRLPPPQARRLIRKGAGLTQRDLAVVLGVTHEAVCQ